MIYPFWQVISTLISVMLLQDLCQCFVFFYVPSLGLSSIFSCESSNSTHMVPLKLMFYFFCEPFLGWFLIFFHWECFSHFIVWGFFMHHLTHSHVYFPCWPSINSPISITPTTLCSMHKDLLLMYLRIIIFLLTSPLWLLHWTKGRDITFVWNHIWAL